MQSIIGANWGGGLGGAKPPLNLGHTILICYTIQWSDCL